MDFFVYALFPLILNLSITSSFVIIAVILARFLLRKVPKIFSYVLWAVVLFRLVLPFSFESAIGLLPDAQSITQNTIYTSDTAPLRDFYTNNLNSFDIQEQNDTTLLPSNMVNVEPSPNTTDNVTGSTASTSSTNDTVPISNNTQNVPIIPLIMFLAWVIGASTMLIYGIVRYIALKQKLIGAMHLSANIYHADHISSPFVMGIIKPKIYLPSTLPMQEEVFIIAHEQCHIRRFDYLTRILAYIALSLHWFNPLVWLAYVLSSRDMEMSCDETVMQKMDKDIRAEYICALVRLATDKKLMFATPLAFDDGDPKGRINNIMKYKKPIIWVSILAVLVVIVFVVAFMSTSTNDTAPVEDEFQGQNNNQSQDYLSIQVNGEEFLPTLYVNTSQISSVDDLPVLNLERTEQELVINYPEQFGDNAYFTIETNVGSNSKSIFNAAINGDSANYINIINAEGNEKVPFINYTQNSVVCYIQNDVQNKEVYAFRVHFQTTLDIDITDETTANIYFWKDDAGTTNYSLLTHMRDTDFTAEAMYDDRYSTSDVSEIVVELSGFTNDSIFYFINAGNFTSDDMNDFYNNIITELVRGSTVVSNFSSILSATTRELTTHEFEAISNYNGEEVTKAEICVWNDDLGETYFTLFHGDDINKSLEEIYDKNTAINDINEIANELVQLGEYLTFEFILISDIPHHEIVAYGMLIEEFIGEHILYYSTDYNTIVESYYQHDYSELLTTAVYAKILEVDAQNNAVAVELLHEHSVLNQQVSLITTRAFLVDDNNDITINNFTAGDIVSFAVYGAVDDIVFPTFIKIASEETELFLD